jgi:acetolactate synthase-1/2/3 large subunit
MDSSPVVAITGQVPTPLIGRDSFQEADICGITLPVTKHNFLVKDVSDLARIIKEAFYIATTGRPGPVLVDVPKDVSAGTARYVEPGPVELPGYTPVLEPDPAAVLEAAKLIAEAQRPVIYAGGGTVSSGAHEELLRLSELIMAPVTTTLMGIGGFPGNHPLALGMLGMHGTRYANYAVCECDLLVAVGARFDDRVTGKIETFAPEAKIIHIDIDPAEFGKNVRVNVPIAGDVRRVLQKLLEVLQGASHQAWVDKVNKWKKEYPLQFDAGGLKPQSIIRELDLLTAGNARITTEVGQNQMWAAQYLTHTKPRSFISSGGLGTMGFGFPAAIGVQVACPEETVFDIAGDGSIQMNIQELATVVSHDLPVNVAIMNNGFLGMVRQWQELFHQRRYSYTEIYGPDFVKVAEAYGAEGIRVTKPNEVRPALEQAIASSKPVFIDFVVEREENVVPMVPPGASLSNMLG